MDACYNSIWDVGLMGSIMTKSTTKGIKSVKKCGSVKWKIENRQIWQAFQQKQTMVIGNIYIYIYAHINQKRKLANKEAALNLIKSHSRSKTKNKPIERDHDLTNTKTKK